MLKLQKIDKKSVLELQRTCIQSTQNKNAAIEVLYNYTEREQSYGMS